MVMSQLIARWCTFWEIPARSVAFSNSSHRMGQPPPMEDAVEFGDGQLSVREAQVAEETRSLPKFSALLICSTTRDINCIR